MNIIISNNVSKPIYEQITMQVKTMIMNGELNPGDPLPSMRALAKSIHVSVITVQKAYEDLHRDGFIVTTIGRGSFVAAQSNDFIKEQQLKVIEEHIQKCVELAKMNGIGFDKLYEILQLFYESGD